MIIPNVTREHEGSFLCEVSNGIGAGLSAFVKVAVHVGPSVTVFKKLVNIRRGEHVTMRCEATGDHPLDITWRTKTNTIDDSFKFQYRIKKSPMVHGLSSDLTILRTSLHDNGDYTCIAKNIYGHDLGVIKLLVQELPNAPINFHVTNLESRSVTLEWSSISQESNLSHEVMENSQPILKYILQYKKAEVSKTDKWIYSTLVELAKSLKIDKGISNTVELILLATTRYNKSIHSVINKRPVDVVQTQSNEPQYELRDKKNTPRTRNRENAYRPNRVSEVAEKVLVKSNRRLGKKISSLCEEKTVEADMGTIVLIKGKVVHKDNRR
nr:Down syndrome cell adhesion molecule-like protein Dscam2 [Drosophila bipectinata]